MFKKIWNFFVRNKSFVETTQKQQTIAANNIITTKKSKTYLDYNWSPVIEFETGGRNYYEKFLKRLTWPGGDSGVTMGIGADLGYMSKEEFEQYFSHYFTVEQQELIRSVIGLKGSAAKAALPKVRHIELSWEHASDAFVKWTLPKFWKLSNKIWPGLDQLNENTQIALVSIVFNRGSSLNGTTRTEMKNIAPLVVSKNYKEIAKQIRSMKRLWIGKNLDGLIARREKEAKMVEEGLV